MSENDGTSGTLPFQKGGGVELRYVADELGNRWLACFVHLDPARVVDVIVVLCCPGCSAALMVMAEMFNDCSWKFQRFFFSYLQCFPLRF